MTRLPRRAGACGPAEALAWLDARFDLEAADPAQVAPPGLDAMTTLVGLLGNPEEAYPVIHVAGTNGKGSTVAIASAILRAQGMRVGTYTSPDLGSPNQRIAIDGHPIDDEALAEVLGWVSCAAATMDSEPTRFEALTAAALAHFSAQAVDAAVVEVGMGGLHDATNVVTATVAVVTNISPDHVAHLGPGITDIARHKAGIVKVDSRVIAGELGPSSMAVLTAAAEAAGAEGCWRAGEDFECETAAVAHGGRVLRLRGLFGAYPEVLLPLHGAHQGPNAACALAAVEALFGRPLGPEVLAEGMGSVLAPGRMEVLGRRPLCVVDGCHNPAAMAAAFATLAEDFAAVGRWALVMGVLADKGPAAMLAGLASQPGLEVLGLVACAPNSPRAFEPARLVALARAQGLAAEAAPSIDGALERARQLAGPGDGVLVAGSFHVVGPARSRLLAVQPHQAPGSQVGMAAEIRQ